MALRDSTEMREREPLSALWRGEVIQDLQLLTDTQFAAGKFDEAKATLDQAVNDAAQNTIDFPDNKYMLLRLADLYYQQAKTRIRFQATGEAKAVLQPFENCLLAHRRLHESLHQAGVIEKFVRLCRDYGNYAWQVGEAERSLEIMREGLEVDQEMVKVQPNLRYGRLSNQFQLDAAEKLQAGGQFEPAVAQYQRIKENLRETKDLPYVMSLLRTTNLNRLGSCYLEMRDDANALDAFQNAESLLDDLAEQLSTLESDNQNVATYQAELAFARLGKLHSLILIERMDEAQSLFSELSKQLQSDKPSQLRLLWAQAALDEDAASIVKVCEQLCSDDVTSLELYLAATVAAELASRAANLKTDSDADLREAPTEQYLKLSAKWLKQAIAQDDSTDFHVRIPRLLAHPSFADFKDDQLLESALVVGER